MNALCATLGINQIKKLDYILKKKYEIFINYKKKFKNSKFIEVIDAGNCEGQNIDIDGGRKLNMKNLKKEFYTILTKIKFIVDLYGNHYIN